MDLKPGEPLATPGTAPGPLRTDWGGARPVGPGTGGNPGDVRAPDGSLRAGPAPAAEPGGAPQAPIAPAAQSASQYRRYINEYLEALATSPAGGR